jgi:hypothetical protein
MKKIIILMAVLTLIGCTTTREVLIPVWTPPKFDEPVKPILISDGNGSDGVISRNLSLDLLNMSEYSLKLETIVKAIKQQPDTSVPKDSQNNK